MGSMELLPCTGPCASPLSRHFHSIWILTKLIRLQEVILPTTSDPYPEKMVEFACAVRLARGRDVFDEWKARRRALVSSSQEVCTGIHHSFLPIQVERISPLRQQEMGSPAPSSTYEHIIEGYDQKNRSVRPSSSERSGLSPDLIDARQHHTEVP
jgi:hypothetical protein